MNSTWQHYLLEAGAVISDGCVSHFGNPRQELQATARGAIIADLSHHGVLRFAGEDAQIFLQGQLCNDIRLVNPGAGQFSGYCSPKGRMLANFLIWQSDADYYLQLSGQLRESIQKRLSMFVLRSKVRISDAGDDVVRLGLAGQPAAAALQQLGSLPQRPLEVVRHDACLLIRLPGDRFELVAPPAQAAGLWKELSPICTPVGAPCWDWLEIRAGIPLITPPTQEQFVPQMANFELIGGVNFRKGCYPGQEIVARTQYLGKLKRRMYLAHVAADVAPQPGDELFSPDLEGQPSGMIVNAQPSPEGGVDVLAVIQTASAAGAEVRLKSADGPALGLEPLPYPLP